LGVSIHFRNLTRATKKRFDIKVDILDIETLKIYDYDGNKVEILTDLIYENRKNLIVVFLRLMSRIKKIKFICSSFILKFINKQYFKKYESINFHVSAKPYFIFMPRLSKEVKRVIIIIWGSDFFRESDFGLKLKKWSYDSVDQLVLGTPQSLNAFISRFPDLKDKSIALNFGNSNFPLIKKLKESPFDHQNKSLKKLVEKKGDKIMIGIGYNNIVEQNQEKVIERIAQNLDESKHILYFCMSYPNDSGKSKRIESLRKKVESCTDVDFIIEDKYLSDQEIAEIRSLTDIYINAQKTDMFSASIQEYFFGGSIVLNGDWLPYEIYDEHQLVDVKFNWDNLFDQFQYCLSNYNSLKKECGINERKISQISSWENIIDDWGKSMNLITTKLITG